MGFFDKKQSISRSGFRSALRKTALPKPRTGGRRYARGERIGFEKDLFHRKYGRQISRKEYRTVLEKMRRSKIRAKSTTEKLEIQRKVDFLKRLGGI